MKIEKLYELTKNGEDVFTWYGLPVDQNVLSPLNPNDTMPSFRISLCEKSGKYRYKDFGESDVSGDAIDFVVAKEDLSIEDAIQFIIEKLNLNNMQINSTNSNSEQDATTPKKSNETMVTQYNWEGGIESIFSEDEYKDLMDLQISIEKADVKAKKNEDIVFPEGASIKMHEEEKSLNKFNEYWNQFIKNNPLGILKKYEIIPINRIDYKSVNRFSKEITIKQVYSYKDDIAHAYFIGEDKLKIYKPMSKDFKHYSIGLGKVDPDFMFGYKQLNTQKNYAIIAAGPKDTMCISALNFNTCCLSSETATFKTDNYNMLTAKLGNNLNLFTIYDNDHTGRNRAEKLKQDFNIPSLIDVVFERDFVRERGLKDFADVIAYIYRHKLTEEFQRLITDISKFIVDNSKLDGNVQETFFPQK